MTKQPPFRAWCYCGSDTCSDFIFSVLFLSSRGGALPCPSHEHTLLSRRPQLGPGAETGCSQLPAVRNSSSAHRGFRVWPVRC